MTVKHITGLTAIGRAVRNGYDVSQEVVIRDRDGAVFIELSETSYGARLTPEQARALVVLLSEAADRAALTEEWHKEQDQDQGQ